MKCFLDMDGVLVDFVGGACRAHGVENPYGCAQSLGEWELGELCGLTDVEFWSKMNNHYFWAALRPTPDFERIMRAVEAAFCPQNVCLLTTPCESGGSASGKMAWIDRYLHAYRRRFLIGPPKFFCAHPGAILIDDNDKNVDEFVQHGGQAILLPRPWNRNYQFWEDAVGYLQDQLGRVVMEATV